uniref:Uncharacterized protein n=1 Tax=Oryza nivara TaxID=4536 RepID=A0A0E0GML4_ORYNI
MVRVIRSLGDVKALLRTHGDRIGLTVSIGCLWRIRHARRMRALLRQQMKIDGMHWEVEGIEHLNAMVRVHRVIATAAPLLDQIISPSRHASSTPGRSCAACTSAAPP